jgi:hypothetical protein
VEATEITSLKNNSLISLEAIFPELKDRPNIIIESPD